jgi:exopolysaccharide biosynthesis polyprenyl glycosylphosphotransferase
MEAATQTAIQVDATGGRLDAATREHRAVSHRRRSDLRAERRGYVLRRLLVVTDILALVIGLAVATGVNGLAGRPPSTAVESVLFIAFIPVFVVLATLARLYHRTDRQIDYSLADDLGAIFLVVTVWSWFLLISDAIASEGIVPLLGPLTLWATTLLVLPLVRTIVRHYASGRDWYQQSAMLVGSAADLDRLRERVNRHPDWGLRIAAEYPVGSALDLDARIEREVEVVHARPKIGHAKLPTSDGLLTVAEDLGVDRVIIGSWPGDLSSRTQLVRILIAAGIHVDLVSGEPDLLTSGGVLHHIEGMPMLNLGPSSIAPAGRLFKRALDVAVSGLALLALSPLMGYLALRIKLDSKGPVLFRQRRGGRWGEVFEVVKFRTMVDGADALRDELRSTSMNGESGLFKIKEDPRITKFGAWMRRRSLDELPQLWNVLKGDMTLVGPRPLPLDEIAQLNGHRAVRESVRPGITGHWQTLGRSDIPFEDMVKLDYAYVVNWTATEDIRILLKTAEVLLQSRRGAY